VYPLLAIADAVASDVAVTCDGAVTSDGDSAAPEFLYVGSPGGIEESILARTEIPYRTVDSAPIRGAGPRKLWSNVGRLLRGCGQSLRLLKEWPADVVLVSGAYVCVPVSLAARWKGIPVLVYLPDREPGLAIRLLSWLVNRIAVSFDEVIGTFPAANRGKVWVSGYPVRVDLIEAGDSDRAAACETLGLDPDLKTVLVLGGSRGARAINEALVGSLPDLLEQCQIVHISGQLDAEWVRQESAKLPAGLRARHHPYAYMHEELAAAMAAADLVVARAGAATLAEFPAVGLPSVLVPYPHSGQHQAANADFMSARGAGVRVDNDDLPAQLKPTVLGLLSDEQALERMAASARALARPEAASRLAQELQRLALGETR
jgi:UDP-N-acetylglucosamine--N-acetylmuramyl-(pentapeptide) pyrophosphoryl-undecaprenol N-acetylglucosamine transferase